MRVKKSGPGRVPGLIVAALMAATPLFSMAQPTPVTASPVASLAPVVEAITPAVVGISVSQSSSGQNPLMNDPAFRRFFEDMQREKGGGADNRPSVVDVRPAGSGVIIDAKEGLVLTNHHVIQGSSRIVVVLKDRREYEARLVGSDAGTDIAVLKIQADRLSALPMGDSDAARVGDFVIAVGNPFSIGQTVTSGIVSALGRGISPEGYEDYIQTDAAINPGNSGGALVNMRGELIGINTAILSGGGGGGGQGGRPGGNIGIGFAVPTNMAREVVAQITRFGEVKRGRIGVQASEVTPKIAAERKLPGIAGAVISQIAAGSSAEKAGLRLDDVVLQINGRPVRTGSDLRNRVALVPVGSSVDLTVLRGGSQQTVKVSVEPIPTVSASNAPGSGGGSSGTGKSQDAPAAGPGGGSGAGGSALNGMELSARRDGLLVAKVAPGSNAHAVGFREGDQIIAVDREAVQTTEQFAAKLRPAGRKSISILRGDSKLRLNIG